MTKEICAICPKCNGDKTQCVDPDKFLDIICNSCVTIYLDFICTHATYGCALPWGKYFKDKYCRECLKKAAEFDPAEACSICNGKGIVWKD